MKNRFIRIAALLLALTETFSVFAAAQPKEAAPPKTFLEQFCYVRDAVRNPYGNGKAPTYYAIAVDGAFFEAMRTAQELCIQRPDGKAVPFLLRKITHTALRPREEVRPGRISLAQTLPDGRVTVDYELNGEAAEISGLELELSPNTVGGTLEVLIGDGRQWERALGVTPLPLLPEAEFGTVRNFPFSRPRHGRLVRMIFGALPEKLTSDFMPFSVARVKTTRFDAEPDAPLLAQGTLELITSEETDGRTEMEFHSDWTPLKNFVFDSNTPNFQRRVTIAGSNDRRHWTELGGGIIRRTGADRSLAVEIPESRYKFYRVSIINGKFPPLASPRLRTGKVQYELLLSADCAPSRLTIYYGTNEPFPPTEGTVKPPPPGAAIGSYQLTEPTLNPLRRRGVSDFANYRFFAGGAILCCALATVLYAVRSLRRSKESLPRD